MCIIVHIFYDNKDNQGSIYIHPWFQSTVITVIIASRTGHSDPKLRTAGGVPGAPRVRGSTRRSLRATSQGVL